MNRTSRALAGIASSYAATAATAIVGFVVVPIVLRFVTREQYGLWAAIGQAVGYLALFDVGVGSAVTRRTAQLHGSADRAIRISQTVSTALAFYSLLSVLFLGFGLLAAPLVPRLLSVPGSAVSLATTIFLLMVVYGALALPLRVFVKALYGMQWIAPANVVTLVENILSPTSAAIMLLVGVGIVALPAGTIAAGLVAGATAAFLFRRAVPSASLGWRQVRRDEAHELFTWSWLLGLNSLAVVVIYQTDSLVVAAGSGLAAATTYSLTSRLPLYAMPLIFALADACLPAVVELCEQRRVDKVRPVHLSVLRVSVGLATGVAIIAVALNGPFMRLWVGGQNFGGELLTLTVATILIYRVILQTAAMVVIGAGLMRGVVLMSAVEAALNLALSLWWVRRYGIVGVAMATVVAGLCTSAWYVVRTVSAALRIPVTEYIARGIIMPLACGVPAAAVALMIRRGFLIDGWLDVAIAGTAIATVYTVTFGWIGLAPGERQEFSARLRASGFGTLFSAADRPAPTT